MSSRSMTAQLNQTLTTSNGAQLPIEANMLSPALTQPTAVDFFNAMIERYPKHLGRTVLWTSARTLYGAREHPEEDFGKIVVAAWLEP